MFFLKKLISYLILPPGIFIALFLLIAVLSRKRKVVYIPAVAGALTLYLISVEPVKDLLFLPLEGRYKQPSVVEGDVIVVLGGGAYNSGYLKASSYKRLITGFLLHRRTGKPIILSGGASIGVIPEAKIMRELLMEFGVSDREIYADLRSRDTYENAKYVRELCERLGCRKVTLVTSAFHMARAVRVFEKAGLEVQPYPTDFKFEGRYNLYSLFPKYSVFYDSSIAIREHIGTLFYKLFY
ncbi:MAG: YdcF family protein [Aquificae bacterium]|nr:YdcF family protein [Aquificota bacterium]